MAVQASRKYDAAGGRYDSRKERCPLFERPQFSHRFHVVGCKFSDLSIAPRHFVEMPRCAASAAAAFLLLNALAPQFKAGLPKPNDEFASRDVMACCRPVGPPCCSVAAFAPMLGI